MSTSAGGRQAANASSRSKVPVAGPPIAAVRSDAARPVGLDPGPDPAEALFSRPPEFWTPPALKGWAVSLVLHGALATVAGSLVFRAAVPAANQLR